MIGERAHEDAWVWLRGTIPLPRVLVDAIAEKRTEARVWLNAQVREEVIVAHEILTLSSAACAPRRKEDDVHVARDVREGVARAQREDVIGRPINRRGEDAA